MPIDGRRARFALLLSAALLLDAACNGDGRDKGKLGMDCEADGQCGGLSCTVDRSQPKDLAPAATTCAEPAEGGAPGEACESADDCDHGLCVLAGACALPCARDVDCARDERCADVFARTASDALQPLRACVRRVELPEDAQVRFETRADALVVGDDTVELDATKGAARTWLVLEHSDQSWPGKHCFPPLCLDALRALDDGRTLFDSAADYTTGVAPLLPVATSGHVNPLVLRLPTPGEPAFSADGYEADLTTEHAGDLELTTIVRAQQGQRLDLNVFYVGALALEPAGARGPPPLADALDVVDEILGQAGIFLGEVRQIAVRGALPMRGTYFPEGDMAQGFTLLHVRYGAHVELPGLFRLSAGAGNGAVNLFLLSDIDPPMLAAEPQADSGGIPGPPGMQGTAGSGIAIASDMMVGDPQAFGRTLAHEIAHYLGLFHTSEADGRVLDNLADTPACLPDQDALGDGLDRLDCVDHGADNLMFWAKATGTTLTPLQREVLAGSPLLR